MPALIDLKTNLKSLGYGDDRPGGASSDQPYIQIPIPEERVLTSPDFLLRNGYLNPQSSLEDVSRLTKYFTDIKSPNGILFTTKQELLERQNPKLVNINRVYNPFSTILQAGVVSTGGHLNKQGISPNEPSYYVGGTYGYYFATRGFGTSPSLQTLSDGTIENRLTIAYTAKIAKQELGPLSINPFGITNITNNTLLSYSGGPGAPLGIGLTNIRIQNPTRDVENIKLESKFQPSYVSTDIKDPKYLVISNGKRPSINWKYNPRIENPGVSNAFIFQQNLEENQTPFYPDDSTNLLLNRKDIPASSVDTNNDIYLFDYSQSFSQESKFTYKSTALVGIKDFRQTINDNEGENVIPSTDYSIFNRETKYKTSVTTYQGNFKNGERILDPNIAISLDQNELGMMGEDIVDFNFTLILNDNPNDDQNRLIDFKAYIETWSDSAQGEWNGIKYMGRAENLYKYNGFSRAGSVTFVVPTLSRGDMISNYRKLNALMWAVAPSYSDISTPIPGLMRGSIVNFTMGNYFRRMPCIIKSINYTEVEGMGWDINRDTLGQILPTDNDLYVGQLPKGIRVQVDFTPLHNFVPQYGEAFIGQDSIYIPPLTGKSIWKTKTFKDSQGEDVVDAITDKLDTTSRLNYNI
jgi:hypothetical protein